MEGNGHAIKIALIIVIIGVIVGLTVGIVEKGKAFEESERAKAIMEQEAASNEELHISVDKFEYISEFEAYLNELASGSEGNGENGGRQYSLIGANMLDMLVKHAEDEVGQLEPGETPVDNSGNGEIFVEEPVEFPILDLRGNIVAYGTKEESEESRRAYAEQPDYKVEAVDIYVGNAIFKVWAKGLSKVEVYEVELGSDLKMLDFKKLTTL